MRSYSWPCVCFRATSGYSFFVLVLFGKSKYGLAMTKDKLSQHMARNTWFMKKRNKSFFAFFLCSVCAYYTYSAPPPSCFVLSTVFYQDGKRLGGAPERERGKSWKIINQMPSSTFSPPYPVRLLFPKGGRSVVRHEGFPKERRVKILFD